MGLKVDDESDGGQTAAPSSGRRKMDLRFPSGCPSLLQLGRDEDEIVVNDGTVLSDLSRAVYSEVGSSLLPWRADPEVSSCISAQHAQWTLCFSGGHPSTGSATTLAFSFH